MSEEKLLDAILEYDRIAENLLQNGLQRIARMQNLSLNNFEQITKIQNLSQNKLEQTAKTRRIKNYKDISKEDLLIALLKPNQSHAELQRTEDNNAEIKRIKRIFNKLKNNFSKEEIKKIRRKFRFKESIDEYLKELGQKDSLTSKKNKRKSVIPRNYKRLKSFLKS